MNKILSFCLLNATRRKGSKNHNILLPTNPSYFSKIQEAYLSGLSLGLCTKIFCSFFLVLLHILAYSGKVASLLDGCIYKMVKSSSTLCFSSLLIPSPVDSVYKTSFHISPSHKTIHKSIHNHKRVKDIFHFSLNSVTRPSL